jgi:hypothetical protein
VASVFNAGHGERASVGVGGKKAFCSQAVAGGMVDQAGTRDENTLRNIAHDDRLEPLIEVVAFYLRTVAAHRCRRKGKLRRGSDGRRPRCDAWVTAVQYDLSIRAVQRRRYPWQCRCTQ